MDRRKFLRETIIATGGVILWPTVMRGEERDQLPFESQAVKEIDVTTTAGKKFTHYWSKCVGAGRANEGLRTSWMEQLKKAKTYCGFEYCRFHGLFHDDMFVYKDVEGKPKYNWQYVDDLFDRMLEIGVRPFVELGFVPKAMALTTNTTFWWKGNSAPPSDYHKWGEMVGSLVSHCIGRYGLNEVKQWYFEVWNEPDLHGFWDGTKSQYFELYKTSVNAIKAIDKNLRVGGPATSNFVPDDRFDGEIEDKSHQKTLVTKDLNTLDWHAVWVKDFIDYCAKEQLPVDFISTHPYPTDYAIDPETKKGAGRVRNVNATRDDLIWLRKTISESAYPNVEIHCTEWSSSPSPRDATHDSLPAAAYVIKANIDGIGLVDSLSYWTFTDVFEEGGAGDSIFHGGFGLINYQGIVKPTFHAYRMLNRLGDEIIHQEEGMLVTRHSKNRQVTALLYHYPKEYTDVVNGNVGDTLASGSPKKFTLNLSALPPGKKVLVETLDREHGFAYATWKKMGSPEPPTREQTSQLKQLAMAVKNETAQVNANGELRWERTLRPWDCVLLSSV